MYNIAVERLPEDPEAQGVIRAQDGSWQLVIDKEGIPHLWVRAKHEDGRPGMVCVEHFMQEGMNIEALMKSEFGGELSPEDQVEAEKEWSERDAENHIPYPR
jgi:hypothetical protein